MLTEGMFIAERYEIIGKIGAGGMSDVYKAKDHKLNRHVAVKVLKQEFSENTNFVSKFRVEAQAAASLMHPNIVNVYDVGEDNGIYYIVMELVDGITLKKYIEKKARLSVREALSIAIQACMGIEAAHNNHIIHRDIKPSNILITNDGTITLIDFHISRIRSGFQERDTQVAGTVGYAPPEQFGLSATEPRADIYALGVLFNQMLSGEHPSVRMCRGYPAHIVRKCTRTDVESRYPSVVSLKRALLLWPAFLPR